MRAVSPLRVAQMPFGKLLLRLYNYIAVALSVALAVVDSFFFYVAHGNDNSYKFHNTINN